ncbi:hypothetical protein [Rhodococcus sp. IEGM 1408]|uniref:hypothetical protein n=1 Tax=Rhodococcus sp. IEGM 1408 TaxID=3082220 RepID=UPI0029530F10|nr:hypothetical protein [Rhodococcus sp. IEGM 1408]MDV8001696.1 hypothetical protein [Rhodococcus sp. IEGM 1408]
MPMHYPPLGDGTYRVGDPPRPLPSPVPGPDPASSTNGHAHGPYHEPGPPLPDDRSGHGPLPGDAPGEKRPGGALAAAAIVGVLGLVVVVVLGLALFGPGSGTGPGTTDAGRGALLPQAGSAPDRSPGASFSVEGRFTVVASPGEPVSGDGAGCALPVSLSDLGEGTEITISEGAFATIGSATLAYDGGDLSSCTFTFDFADVPAGSSFYLIEIPGRGQLTYTEDELRAGVDITLGR